MTLIREQITVQIEPDHRISLAQSDYTKLEDRLAHQEAEIERLQADLAACQQALHIYANPLNWHDRLRGIGERPDWLWCGPPNEQHPNTWAKDALKERP